jgi:hypothetical protein
VELLYRNGYGILVARSKTTKVQIGKGAFAKDFLTCSLWETQGVFFLQQRAYGGAVRRRWYADARREMVAHYVHIRPQSVVQPPVKVIDFRVTQDCGFRLMWSLTTIAMQIERSRECYPSHYDDAGNLKPEEERLVLVKKWLKDGFAHTWGQVLGRSDVLRQLHCPLFNDQQGNPSSAKSRPLDEDGLDRPSDESPVVLPESPGDPAAGPDRSGTYAIEGYFGFTPASIVLLCHWGSEIGGSKGGKERASVKEIFRHFLCTRCAEEFFVTVPTPDGASFDLSIDQHGAVVDLASFDTFLTEKAEGSKQSRVRTVERNSIFSTGARGDSDLCDWLIALKARPSASWVFKALVFGIGDHIERSFDRGAADTGLELQAVAVLGRRFDPAVRQHLVGQAIRARVARNAGRLVAGVRAASGGQTSSKRRLGKERSAPHSKVEGLRYYTALRQEFTDADFLEIDMDDSRFPSTLGETRDHCLGCATNQATGVSGIGPCIVRRGQVSALTCNGPPDLGPCNLSRGFS